MEDVTSGEAKTPAGELDVTPRELRSVNLPLQPFGGYSKAETDRLLERAASTLEQTTSSLEVQISELRTALATARRGLEEEASRKPESVEEAAGDVLVSAHRAAELLRTEASQEIEVVLSQARAEAEEIVGEAQGKADAIDVAKVRAEAALAQTEADARNIREDAERRVAELHAEARRVHLVVDGFRKQWRDLISDALRQLELSVPGGDALADGPEQLHDDLRTRVAETGEAEGVQQDDSGYEFGPRPQTSSS
jgi:cell division septum initiation protein DivIVA